MTAAKAIHRADLNGRAICGARGRVIISSALWTCADCQRLSAPANRENVMAQIKRAAQSQGAK